MGAYKKRLPRETSPFCTQNMCLIGKTMIIIFVGLHVFMSTSLYFEISTSKIILGLRINEILLYFLFCEKIFIGKKMSRQLIAYLQIRERI